MPHDVQCTHSPARSGPGTRTTMGSFSGPDVNGTPRMTARHDTSLQPCASDTPGSPATHFLLKTLLALGVGLATAALL